MLKLKLKFIIGDYSDEVKDLRIGFPIIDLYADRKIIMSGTVWIGTEPCASIPVPERYRSTCPHYKLSGPIYTRIVSYTTERDPQITGSRIGTERYRMSDSFTDVDRWSASVPIPYRSKISSMDRVIIYHPTLHYRDIKAFKIHCYPP